ncbi:MAG TPA: zinc-dependent metalloprotease [Saprospiraceae bacterium]|nr:zinc-dependent metalloprotease [Saprospiraceae bacterium]
MDILQHLSLTLLAVIYFSLNHPVLGYNDWADKHEDCNYHQNLVFREQNIEFTRLFNHRYSSTSPQTSDELLPENEIIFQKTNDKIYYYKVDTQLLQEILNFKPERLKLTLSFEGKDLILNLEKAEIFSDYPEVYYGTHENKKRLDYQPGVYYRSARNGNHPMTSSISFFEDDIIGIIQDDKSPIDLGYLDNKNGRKTDTLVLRRSDDAFRQINFECEVWDPPGTPTDFDDDYRYLPETRSSGLCFRQYVEANFHLYQNKGSNVTNTVNYLTGLYNQVIALYQNEQIILSLSEIFVWTQNDPYGNGTSTNHTNFSNAMSGGFNGNLAHLVTLNPNSSGGIAWYNTVCSSNNSVKTAVSKISSSYNNVPAYSWSVMVITHEVGHNLGSRHTHACVWNGNNTPIDCCGQKAGYGENTCTNSQNNNCNLPDPAGGGTIMSYCHLRSVGINFNHGFGPQPGNRIRSVLGGCPDCSLALGECQQTNIHISSKPPGNTVAAIQQITSNWSINPSSNPALITFKAGGQVILQPGFHAMAGSQFQAYIEACPGSLVEYFETNQLLQPLLMAKDKLIEKTSKLTVYPNVASINTTIEIEIEREGEIQLMIFNQSGQVIKQLLTRTTLTSGIHTYDLNLETIPVGVYYITLVSSGDIQTKRLIVVR